MKKEISLGAFDSELMHQEISIPDGFEAVIEGDKIILKKIGSEDERIRDEIIDFLKLPHPQFVGKRDHEKWISWLEKRDNQKETLCDKCKKAQPSHSCQDITALGRCYIEAINASSNKVKPKFKDGDYIKHNKANLICKIISVNNGSYYVENIRTSGRIELFHAEQNFHLWTIADAKDGDVLATLDYILIFEKVLSKDYGVSHCHYGFGNTTPQFNFNKDDNWYFGKEAKVYPATKEQRDLLFQKMHEAGYEWDAENLQLTKILHVKELSDGINIDKQKLAEWSEEDEKMFRSLHNLIYVVPDCDCDSEKKLELSNWFKSLKGRVQPQYEWSEEEIEKAAQEWETKANFSPFYMTPTGVKQDITTHKKSFKAGINWFLKFLKGRVQPQNAWKPSDEQLNSLKQAINAFPYETDYLELLYDDLKKLKGE